MNWHRDDIVAWRPVKPAFWKVFYWIKDKLGLSEYGMAALVWVKGSSLACCSASSSLMISMKYPAVLLLASAAPAALAQKEIPRLKAMTSAHWATSTRWGPLRSTHLLRVAPTHGKACKEGWMNIGAGYCKKKRGPRNPVIGTGCCTFALLEKQGHMTPSHPAAVASDASGR